MYLATNPAQVLDGGMRREGGGEGEMERGRDGRGEGRRGPLTDEWRETERERDR